METIKKTAANDATNLQDAANQCGQCRRWQASYIGTFARFGICRVRPGLVRTYTTADSRCDVARGLAFVRVDDPKVPA